MNLNITLRSAFTGVRRHPVLAAAVCAPLVAASVFTGSTMASANSVIPSLAVSSAAANAAPAPHVLIVDNQMAGQVVQGKQASTAPRETWNIDGCDHDYGAANDCVPWTIPGSTATEKCAWLRSNGFGALKVAGTNRQHLPTTLADGKAYACA